MSEVMKINLTRIGITLAILMTCSSVVGAGYIAYDNAKTAKLAVDKLEEKGLQWEQRLDGLENRQARFEGMIDERTKNTAKRVDDIYAIVKEWTP